jgi:hypothetical protein
MPFFFKPNLARYYRSDKTTPITQETLRLVRDQLADGLMEEFANLSRSYTAGDLTLGQIAEQFAVLVRQGTTAGFLLGGGGVNAVKADTMNRIDALIGEQTDFAERFMRDLAGAGLSEKEAAARAQMYAGTAVTAYEEARAVSNGIDLPCFPGDGGTSCLTRCRCSWTIETTDDEVSAWWDTAGDTSVCAGCFSRSQRYNPLVMHR